MLRFNKYIVFPFNDKGQQLVVYRLHVWLCILRTNKAITSCSPERGPLFYIEEMKIRNGLNKDPQYKQAKKNVVDFEVTIWYEGEGLREI